MKKLFSILVLVAFTIGGFSQETHFDFSITNSTGYDIYYRIVDAENQQVEVTYPCQHNDNYWWGYIKPEGKLILSDTVTYDGIDYTLVAIGDHAFCGCSELRGELVLPESIQSIGAGAFKGCANMNGNLTIPTLVSRIEDETFSGCSGLSGILTLSDSLTFIGDNAFYDCSHFSGQLIIAGKVTSIGSHAFENCSFSGKIMLPSTLTAVGEQAFKGCSNINCISIKAVAPPTTGSNAFEGIASWITVAVPYTAKEAYQNAPEWSKFADRTVEKSYWNGMAEPWTKGSGTTDDPYLIESAENLAWLAQTVNKPEIVITHTTSPGGVPYDIYHFYDVYAYQDTCFKLVIDIDLRRGEQFWTPIGNFHYIDENEYDGEIIAPHYSHLGLEYTYYYYTYFSGQFDGNNHSIDNYNVYADFWNDDGRRYYGLFGLTYEASFFDLNLGNFSINIQKSSRHIGSLLGYGSKTMIFNCHASGNIHSGNITYGSTANPTGGIAGTTKACRIENCTAQISFYAYTSFVGGIVGQMICDTSYNQNDGIFHCGYVGKMEDLDGYVGGIVGSCKSSTEGAGSIRIENCFSRGSMTRGIHISSECINTKLGGIVGRVENIDTLRILNCYSNDTLTGSISTGTHVDAYAGGIIAMADANTILYLKNCYHVGPISSKYKGGILAQNTNMTIVRNSFFEESSAPDDGFGVPMSSDYMKTEAFVNQLNNGSTVFRMDTEPYENGGYPVFGTDGLIFVGAEWFYEIHGEDGTITYQHLRCVGDTTINEERPKVIVRSNTQYDREGHTEITHEYVYEENGVVYWWNKTLGKFTVLYDFSAEEGDEWTIEVDNETITTHVYEAELQYIDGIPYKKLTILDPNNDFSGTVLSCIGHQTSFFPERLMNRGKGYRVDGLRCYWVDDELVYKQGDEDCDAIYAELHNGIEEDGLSTGSGALTVYPNPANDVLFVETHDRASQPNQTYRITNLMGQTILSGNITIENQQIDITNLREGMYLISVGGQTFKFVKQ